MRKQSRLRRLYNEYYSLFAQKDVYTKEDIADLIELFHGKFLALTFETEWRKAVAEEKERELLMEHEKSLAFLMENETQKLELQILNEKLAKTSMILEEISKTDTLTSLANRRALSEYFSVEFARAKRTREKLKQMIDNSAALRNGKDGGNKQMQNAFGRLSCVLIDVDNFKIINDKHGHLTGDQVLRKIGSLLSNKNNLRVSDFIGRYGGDEFILVFPETSADNAKIPIEGLIEKMRTINFISDSRDEFRVTLSAGVAEYRDEDTEYQDIINRADRALYRVKEQGRGRVLVYDQAKDG